MFTKPKCYAKHVAKCTGRRTTFSRDIPTGKENIDYVRCEICHTYGKTLRMHLTTVHHISKEEYVRQFPGAPITCENSAKKFKARGVNADWIRRAKERGDDLSEYKKKMGAAVREAIMANPKERARRSELAKTTIIAWATSDEGRRTASETAKKTSARPEIIEQRTKRLVDS